MAPRRSAWPPPTPLGPFPHRYRSFLSSEARRSCARPSTCPRSTCLWASTLPWVGIRSPSMTCTPLLVPRGAVAGRSPANPLLIPLLPANHSLPAQDQVLSSHGGELLRMPLRAVQVISEDRGSSIADEPAPAPQLASESGLSRPSESLEVAELACLDAASAARHARWVQRRCGQRLRHALLLGWNNS